MLPESCYSSIKRIELYDTNPDLTVNVMASREFNVDDVLGKCYDSDFSLSEEESSCAEGENVPAYCG